MDHWQAEKISKLFRKRTFLEKARDYMVTWWLLMLMCLWFASLHGCHFSLVVDSVRHDYVWKIGTIESAEKEKK